jgi:hypothetical protein
MGKKCVFLVLISISPLPADVAAIDSSSLPQETARFLLAESDGGIDGCFH